MPARRPKLEVIRDYADEARDNIRWAKRVTAPWVSQNRSLKDLYGQILAKGLRAYSLCKHIAEVCNRIIFHNHPRFYMDRILRAEIDRMFRECRESVQVCRSFHEDTRTLAFGSDVGDPRERESKTIDFDSGICWKVERMLNLATKMNMDAHYMSLAGPSTRVNEVDFRDPAASDDDGSIVD